MPSQLKKRHLKGDMMLKNLYQHLYAGHTAQFLATIDPSISPANAWKAYFEGRALGDDAISTVLKGWRSYYNADYQGAIPHFNAALQMESEWHSYALLGLGKVASDLLCFEQSVGYLKQALELARRENDFVRLTEGYGSLGEVAFRCGDYQTAYELVSLDKALLAPGSIFEYRLNNYLAICAGRLGHDEWAKMKLKANYFSSLSHQPYSSDYSLASLFMCAWVNHQPLDDCLRLLSQHTFQVGTHLPQGVIALVQFWVAEHQSEQIRYLERAMECFVERYPLEKQYCQTLLNMVTGDNESTVELKVWYDRHQKADWFPNIDMIKPSIVDQFVALDFSNASKMLQKSDSLEDMKGFTRSMYI